MSIGLVLGSFTIFLPLLIGEHLDRREEARVARRAEVQTGANPERSQPDRSFKDAA